MDQDNGKKWAMPEPTFRRSTGELVTPAADNYIDPEPDTLAPDAADEPEVETAEFDIEASKPTPPTPPINDDPLAKLYDPPPGNPAAAPAARPVPAAPAVNVEPQPFISEQFTADNLDVGTSVPAARSTGRSALAVIGVLLLIVIAAAIAAVVYFLFFAGRTVPAAS